ncbi:MAG: hypothetical protein U9N49_12630 [Campylobacterota bacterium]|nr:hypothetical protein [Campylobacterota bacterium]
MKILYTLLLTLLLTTSAYASFERYCNARFGFCVDVDRNWGEEATSVNNDGRSFFNTDGFRMSVYGSYNALDQTLEAHQEGYKSEFERITYEVKKQSWYALTGLKDDELIYIKTFLRHDTFYTLYVRYPQATKSHYNWVVTRLAKSFQVTAK